MRSLVRTVVVLVGLLAPAAALAQDGTIAGVVRDPSGAVLPGVTVEASSPVLIEKVRTVVTDGSGQYSIVALPPGTYTVSFTLAGFQRGQAGEHPVDGRHHRHHQRRAARRRARRDGDGHGRIAHRRRPECQPPAGARRRRAPDAADLPVLQRRAPAGARRLRRQRPGAVATRHVAVHRTRRQHAGRPPHGGRHQHGRVARRRRCVGLHPRHAERPGGDLHHLRQPRRGRDGRSADADHPEGRRQHLQRRRAVLRLQRQDAGQQLRRQAVERAGPVRAGASHARLPGVAWWAHPSRPHVVLRELPGRGRGRRAARHLRQQERGRPERSGPTSPT